VASRARGRAKAVASCPPSQEKKQVKKMERKQQIVLSSPDNGKSFVLEIEGQSIKLSLAQLRDVAKSSGFAVFVYSDEDEL
jgi:hypothetical protein